jgi:dihydroxyacetone kinase
MIDCFADHHFIQDHTILVDTALQSVALTNPSLSVDIENKVVYLDVEHPSQVSVISGGGSGHEPSFAGFVGRGLLAASVTGKILQSPEPAQIEAALLKVDSQRGILVIIMNNIVSFPTLFERIEAARSSSGTKID